MRSKALELEIRMKQKPNVPNGGRLYVHNDTPGDVAERNPDGIAEGNAAEGRDGDV